MAFPLFPTKELTNNLFANSLNIFKYVTKCSNSITYDLQPKDLDSLREWGLKLYYCKVRLGFTETITKVRPNPLLRKYFRSNSNLLLSKVKEGYQFVTFNMLTQEELNNILSKCVCEQEIDSIKKLYDKSKNNENRLKIIEYWNNKYFTRDSTCWKDFPPMTSDKLLSIIKSNPLYRLVGIIKPDSRLVIADNDDFDGFESIIKHTPPQLRNFVLERSYSYPNGFKHHFYFISKIDKNLMDTSKTKLSTLGIDGEGDVFYKNDSAIIINISGWYRKPHMINKLPILPNKFIRKITPKSH